MFRTKSNPSLQLKMENGQLFFKNDNVEMDEFREVEFLYAADEESNKALIKEIEQNFHICVVPVSMGIFDYSLLFLH